MYTLQNGNVVKITDSEDKRDKYLAAGFHLVEKVPAADTEGNSPDTENNPEEKQPDTENKPEEKPAKKKA